MNFYSDSLDLKTTTGNTPKVKMTIQLYLIILLLHKINNKMIHHL